MSCGIDFNRILRRRVLADPMRTVVLYGVFPVVIALVIAYAFVLRSEGINQRGGLVFFSTLYAFWCGLFGTCQSINGEVSSGEWSYWVLGCHRSRFNHLLAHVGAGILLSFLQIVVSVFFLCFVFDWCCPYVGYAENQILVNLQSAYLIKDAVFDGVWSACIDFMDWSDRRWGGLMIAPGILLVSMLLAGLSGVGFGILFSCCVKEPLSSLNLSVMYIVVVAILSFTTLANPESPSFYVKEDGNDGRHFTPLYLLCRGYVENSRKTIYVKSRHGEETFQISRLGLGDARVLEWMSFVLPQRYFYNVGRMTFDDRGYLRRPGIASECVARYCRCARCLGVTESWGQWAENFYEGSSSDTFSSGCRQKEAPWSLNGFCGEDIHDEETMRKRIREFVGRMGGLIRGNHWGICSFFMLFLLIALWETGMILILFVVCLAVSWGMIEKRRCFNVLR